jgi:hypothetical protein
MRRLHMPVARLTVVWRSGTRFTSRSLASAKFGALPK